MMSHSKLRPVRPMAYASVESPPNVATRRRRRANSRTEAALAAWVAVLLRPKSARRFSGDSRGDAGDAGWGCGGAIGPWIIPWGVLIYWRRPLKATMEMWYKHVSNKCCRSWSVSVVVWIYMNLSTQKSPGSMVNSSRIPSHEPNCQVTTNQPKTKEERTWGVIDVIAGVGLGGCWITCFWEPIR